MLVVLSLFAELDGAHSPSFNSPPSALQGLDKNTTKYIIAIKAIIAPQCEKRCTLLVQAAPCSPPWERQLPAEAPLVAWNTVEVSANSAAALVAHAYCIAQCKLSTWKEPTMVWIGESDACVNHSYGSLATKQLLRSPPGGPAVYRLNGTVAVEHVPSVLCNTPCKFPGFRFTVKAGAVAWIVFCPSAALFVSIQQQIFAAKEED